jgi:predicted RNase H-like HicB family nuclease
VLQETNMKNNFQKQPNPKLSGLPETVKTLLTKLSQTREDEISCDDVQALLAEFAELHHQGKDIANLMPQVQQHLDLCLACREEYEALLLAIKAEREIHQ